MTRKALDMLKSIAMGEYKPVEEVIKDEAAVEEAVEDVKEEETVPSRG